MLFLAQLVCLVFMALSVLLHRYELIHFKAFAAIFALSLLVLLVISLLVFWQVWWVWYKSQAMRLSLSIALVLSLFCCASIVVLLQKAKQYPLIHSITTDINNPPAFEHASIDRDAAFNSLEYDRDIAPLQKGAYPYIQPLTISLSKEDTLALAQAVSEAMDWEVHYINAEQGIIEASDRSKVFGFVDDILIRVTELASGARVDLRSVSRVGRGDFGANAKRIDDFLKRLESRATKSSL